MATEREMAIALHQFVDKKINEFKQQISELTKQTGELQTKLDTYNALIVELNAAIPEVESRNPWIVDKYEKNMAGRVEWNRLGNYNFNEWMIANGFSGWPVDLLEGEKSRLRIEDEYGNIVCYAYRLV
jgi:hypothetical protein